MYLAIIMKAVSLGLQSSTVNAKNAGRELLGSTFLGGVFAILFWVLLDLLPNLWLYFWCMLLFGIYFSSKIYQLIPSRHPASFWVNVATTLLILLGPAVEDSANGKDVYAAFAVRIGLFIAVTLYAWAAIFLLEHLRSRRRNRVSRIQNTRESPTCS
jgi:4-hydroxybenzoate polyprenyltransferase